MSQLKALAPKRIDTLALDEQPIAEWMRDRTDQVGVEC